MGRIRAQVRLQRTSLLPEDVCVNTFYFRTAATPTAADFDNVHDALTKFYTVPGTGSTSAIATLLSPILSQAAHEIRQYDDELPKPNPPSRVAALTINSNSASAPFPAEVALCLSFRGPVLAGVNPARRRGRVYLGPLTVAAGGATAAGDVRPGASALLIVANAGLSLINHVASEWCIWSEPAPAKVGKSGAPIAANPGELLTVTHCWVDNAYDTQRRRGALPTARESRTVA